MKAEGEETRMKAEGGRMKNPESDLSAASESRTQQNQPSAFILQPSSFQSRLREARRVVIKLGTRTVSDAGGEFSVARVAAIVDSIAELKRGGRQVVLVSSGAVGLGAGRLGLAAARLGDVVAKQACAAVGQSLLMIRYEELFSEHEIEIAQVLLTADDFANRHRYLNLQRTIERLLKLGVLPVINENDTVSTAELESVATENAKPVFSDNDNLAALVMSKLEADVLVLLTNVDGLLAASGSGGESEVVPFVEEITPELRLLATGPSAGGRGGMLTKLDAAQLALRAGGVAVIANGHKPDTLRRLFAGERVGTVLMSTSRMKGKRRWIAYAATAHGRVTVNDGARAAIIRSKASLLSSGVTQIEGSFAPNDVVSIVDAGGQEFARGIANCGSEEAVRFINNATLLREPSGEVASPVKAHVLVTRDNIVVSNDVSE